MKFGVIGAGTFGSRHIQALDRHPAAELVAVLDLNRELSTAIVKFVEFAVDLL